MYHWLLKIIRPRLIPLSVSSEKVPGRFSSNVFSAAFFYAGDTDVVVIGKRTGKGPYGMPGAGKKTGVSVSIWFVRAVDDEIIDFKRLIGQTSTLLPMDVMLSLKAPS